MENTNENKSNSMEPSHDTPLISECPNSKGVTNASPILNGNYHPLQIINPPSNSSSTPPLIVCSPPEEIHPPSVTIQPVSQGASSRSNRNSEWMVVPQHVSSCPPGLEYLTMIDQLLVHQKADIPELINEFDTGNKYSIKNSIGQKVYYAAENSGCCTRNCCGSRRPFDMTIIDSFRNEVIHLYRPLACDSCFYPCCLQTIEVTSPPGTLVGSVEQKWSFFHPKLVIKDASGEIVLRIKGPSRRLNCCCANLEFQVLSADGKAEVGKISKQWPGAEKEMSTGTDNFGISFPIDLDVRMKAVMLGACFLIDFMFFEKCIQKRNNKQEID